MSKTKFDQKIEALFHELHEEHERDNGLAFVVGKKENGTVGTGVFGNGEDVAEIVIDILNRGNDIAKSVFDAIIKFSNAEALTNLVDTIFKSRPDIMRVGNVMKVPADASQEEIAGLISDKIKELQDEERTKQAVGKA